METIYLSGPISLGGKAGERTRKVFTNRFKKATKRLRESGFTVIDPTECPPEKTWENYMRHGMRAVADADIVLVLPQWEQSRGSRLEVFVARELGIPVEPVEGWI